MLNNLKKTAVAVALSGCALSAFAGTMGPVCTPGNVTVPCETTAWDFGGYALYLEPVHSMFGYDTVTTAGNEVTFGEVGRRWGWGFKLEGSYHFSTGNDLNVNWYHLDNDHNHTGVIGFTTPDGTTATTAFDLYRNPQWDAVNVEFGQHVNFGEFKIIRFHGGVQWAQMKDHLHAHVGATTLSRFQNKFDGFGPRVGADMSYQLGNGLAMYANGATALLIGDSKFNAVTTTVGAAAPVFISGTKRNMVPELEAKLGLTYTYAMAQGNLSLDGGYMWVNYFSPMHVLNTADTDFALHGPYVGLKYVGNV